MISRDTINAQGIFIKGKNQKGHDSHSWPKGNSVYHYWKQKSQITTSGSTYKNFHVHAIDHGLKAISFYQV